MSWFKSLSITAVIGIGIALVMWLVSMITGETYIEMWMAGIVLVVFATLWFWVHQSINDPELEHKKQ